MVVTLFLVEERTRLLLLLVAFNLTRDLVTEVSSSCLDQPRMQRFDIFRPDLASLDRRFCISVVHKPLSSYWLLRLTILCDVTIGWEATVDNTNIILDISERKDARK